MLKKKKVEKAVEKVVEKAIERILAPISPLTQDLNREDLNSMRDKINEIIKRIS